MTASNVGTGYDIILLHLMKWGRPTPKQLKSREDTTHLLLNVRAENLLQALASKTTAGDHYVHIDTFKGKGCLLDSLFLDLKVF